MISGEFTINELTTGTQAKPTHGKKTAAARIAALKAAGVDTSNYFPMGEEMVIKVVDGVPEQVMDDDPIFSKIAEGGYIKTQPIGCIDRGRGRNVRANKSKTESEIKGYLSIGCARNAMLTSRAAYSVLVANL